MKTRRDTLFGFTGLAALVLPIPAKAETAKKDLLAVFKEIQEIGDNMFVNRIAIFEQYPLALATQTDPHSRGGAKELKDLNDDFTEMIAQKLDTDILSTHVYVGWDAGYKRIKYIYWAGKIGNTGINFTFRPHTNDILNSYTKRT